jgi:aminopeptidase
MPDQRMLKLADVLVNYSAEVRPGDWVLIQGDVAALPLLAEVQRLVTRAGGHPTVMLSAEEIDEAFLSEASPEQLSWLSPLEGIINTQLDVSIRIVAPGNTRALSGIDPARPRAFQQARRDLQRNRMQRAATGKLRWVLTQFPCAALAQEADMSLRDYENFVYAATFADQPDPVASWRGVHDTQQHLVDWLKGKRDVRVQGPNIDMTLSIAGRTFINSDGRRNMPSGEIYTGPVEDSVNGWVKFSYPAIRGGYSVEGVEFEFRDGKVVQARASKNEEYLLSQLDSDAGARYLGEFAVGTNYGIQRFTRSILYDEKIGGTLHMAVGAGYPETGSTNQSSVHWDFICDMRRDSAIWIDGELFYKDGQFQV